MCLSKQNYKIISSQDIALSRYYLNKMKAWKDFLEILNAYFNPEQQLSKKNIYHKHHAYSKLYPVFQVDSAETITELQNLLTKFVEAPKLRLPETSIKETQQK